ncbi:unnamed protein product [marine sediment metagenome]|uniref:histidine kinase n=1 Tax=marine sediment metagenome TaxID=412755 RepID=X0W6C6_9ZZZZ
MGLYQLQNHFLEKEREAEEEKREKERFREISAFTSGVAHEIKNPLNRLSLLFELLRKKVSPDLTTNVSLGKKEVHEISRIVDQFSTFQKPLKLRKEKFFLENLMKDIRSSLLKEIDQSMVKIHYSQTGPVLLRGDKGLISQVFVNLLKNSLEATAAGDITIQAKQHKNTAFISIRDSGQGMSEEDKNRIFDPYFSKKENGMGIGLYLTKKIIEAHGGQIQAKSEPGHGTTIFFHIPGSKHG